MRTRLSALLIKTRTHGAFSVIRKAWLFVQAIVSASVSTNRSGVVFFTYLQKERSDLLDFHAVGGDKWATVHGWLYYTGRVND
jgi:hypothetical protein